MLSGDSGWPRNLDGTAGFRVWIVRDSLWYALVFALLRQNLSLVIVCVCAQLCLAYGGSGCIRVSSSKLSSQLNPSTALKGRLPSFDPIPYII